MLLNPFLMIVVLLYVSDLFVLVPMYTASKYDHSPRKNKLIRKGICIAIPLAVFVTGFLMKSFSDVLKLYMAVMVLGMLLCAFGDIILEIRFIKGGFLFLGGHFLYVCGMILYAGKITSVTVIVYFVLAALGTFLTYDKLDKKYRKYLIGYNLMISATFALGITLFATNKLVNMLFGTGAMFLVVSDWLLARNKMVGSNFKRSLISLLFYFGGQILISSVVLF